MLKRKTALFMATVLLLMTLTACTKKEEKLDSAYPLKTDVTLTYWVSQSASQSYFANNNGELPFAKELEKATGVKIEWIHPEDGKDLYTLIATDNLPDIIYNSWNNYPGGAEKAIADGYIIPLNDVIDKWSPNFKKIIEKDDGIRRGITTENGDIAYYPMVQHDTALKVTGGMMLRGDWLEELNMSVPESIDEWETVLRAFKNEKGATAPLSVEVGAFGVGAFTGAYGITWNYYQENGKVCYGPGQPEYKDFLITMNRWYNEGLIDKEFAIGNSVKHSENILSGKTGAIYGGLGGSLGAYNSKLQQINPEYYFVGAKYPVLNKGEKPKFGQYTNSLSSAAAISTNCKNVEIAARFIDFGYSEEGSLLYQFGIEGVSYNMENGYPRYTKEITDNPDGIPMATILGKYSNAGFGGPFVQDIRYLEQYADSDIQREAWDLWMDTDSKKYQIPYVLAESDNLGEHGRLSRAVDQYAQEMLVKFILGTEPIGNFDLYIEELYKLGLGDLLQIKQSAYEKYMAK